MGREMQNRQDPLLAGKKILVLYFADYRSRRFENNFHYWKTPTDINETIISPIRAVFGKVDAINYFELFGDCGTQATNGRIISIASELRPDYVLWCSLNYEIFPSTFRTLKKMGSVVVGLSFDDAWRADTYVKHWYHDVDVLLFNDPAYIDYYRKVINTSYFACIPAPSAKTYRKIDGMTKQYDVSFIGSATPYREKIVNYLLANGIQVFTCGENWDVPYVTTEEKVRIINSSKINISMDAVENRKVQIKGRIIEVALAGGFLITERSAGLSVIFTENKNIIAYSQKEELLEKIQYFLIHDDERDEIARTSYEHASRLYSAETVIPGFFQTLENDFNIRGKQTNRRRSLREYLASRKEYFGYNSQVVKSRMTRISLKKLWLHRASKAQDRRDQEMFSHMNIIVRDILYLLTPHHYV